MEWETYTPLSLPGIRHLFTLRREGSPTQTEQQWRPILTAAGFPAERAISAEQPHGNLVGVVRDPTVQYYPLVDALITNLVGVPLVIRVADCGPIYLYDPQRQAIGLIHSGKKGTALNILGETIQAMQKEYGSDPRQVRAFLGPCIRPPYYEVDFVSEIGRQAQAAGITQYVDSGLCTASNLERYYSYRLERGHTGRMWAVLMLA